MTYPEVMAVILAACTGDIAKKGEAGTASKKRSRDDDANDNDEEVNGTRKKRRTLDVKEILGELGSEGFVVDLAVPGTVVEEGVKLVKGMLKDVVVFEE